MIFLLEVELIVLGDVQGVGYRQYVAKIGRRLRLKGFVENLNDGTVRIHCKGDEKDIREFTKQINKKKPEDAPLIDVEDIEERQLNPGTIKQTIFEEIYDHPSAEMSQGFSTGMKYMILFNRETQANLNLFRTDTNTNFVRMDEKYRIISENMIAIVNSIEERNKTFENKIEKIENRMEKTDKSIESLLKILAGKRS